VPALLNRPFPLTCPPCTLSPTGGEGWGEGVRRFMERERDKRSLEFMNSPAAHWPVVPLSLVRVPATLRDWDGVRMSHCEHLSFVAYCRMEIMPTE
jgi:hypothetical protein